jgi:uncharacterized protein (DUF169 family)
MNYEEVANKFKRLLGLEHPAIAIAFVDTAPIGVARLSAPGPASCAYWKLAGEGKVFYTTAEDHLNCTIGAYTHAAQMPPEKATELKSTLGEMVEMSYLREGEVAEIPHRTQPLQFVVYAPLSHSPCRPDVVLIRGNVKTAMLLTEAALAAGVGPQEGITARPTCSLLPQILDFGRLTASFGCIGNRVYTGLGDSELYFAVPGPKVLKLAGELEKIIDANQQLEAFHQARDRAAVP